MADSISLTDNATLQLSLNMDFIYLFIYFA